MPVVAVPIFGDQPYNAERMRVKGFAEVLDLRTSTVEEMVTTIMQVCFGRWKGKGVCVCVGGGGGVRGESNGVEGGGSSSGHLVLVGIEGVCSIVWCGVV